MRHDPFRVHTFTTFSVMICSAVHAQAATDIRTKPESGIWVYGKLVGSYKGFNSWSGTNDSMRTTGLVVADLREFAFVSWPETTTRETCNNDLECWELPSPQNTFIRIPRPFSLSAFLGEKWKCGWGSFPTSRCRLLLVPTQVTWTATRQ